jgi:hypothetical protein
MGRKSGQMMPGICTQGSLTCRKSAIYFPSEGRCAEDFLSPFKNPKVLAGFEPANLGIRGQHATSAPPKPLLWFMLLLWHYQWNDTYLVLP